MDVVIAPTAASLLMAERFLNAELIVYHFGVYHPLFDALLIGNGKAKQAVFFHNVTPPEFAPPAGRDVMRRSLVQTHNLRHADRLWPVSPFNADCLRGLGFDNEKIQVIPLVVDKPKIRSPLEKSDSGDHILFVGRAVESKGLLEALMAFKSLYADQPTSRLVIASNVSFSDPDYLRTCKLFIEEHGLAAVVTVIESPDDDQLCEFFADAHVLLLPTRHEGFCVPVIEALRAGAIPIGFDAGNMRNACAGLGRLVEPGNLHQLSKALETVVENLRTAHSDPGSRALRLDRGVLSLSEFEAEARRTAQQYSFDTVARTIVEHVAELT
jgi:glycosyltransferase involved in cell wall biosynthesis